MTLLLDTCTFLWLLSDDPRLPLRARTECRAPSNAVYLSALSVWEITIKYRLGRFAASRIPGVVRRQSSPAGCRSNLSRTTNGTRCTTYCCRRIIGIRSTEAWCRKRSCAV